jgi:hypothetical protein
VPIPQKVILGLIGLTVILALGVPLVAPCIFNATGWVAFAGAALTFTGWLTREFFALRALRKQHTVTVLLQSRLSTAFNEKYKIMLAKYPVTKGITPVAANDWDDAAKIDAIEAVKYFLNYYEFIAIGIRTGDLDEDFLFLSLGGIVPNLWKLGENYIEFARKKHGSVFENLEWLKNKWRARAEKMALKVAAKKNLPKIPPFRGP